MTKRIIPLLHKLLIGSIIGILVAIITLLLGASSASTIIQAWLSHPNQLFIYISYTFAINLPFAYLGTVLGTEIDKRTKPNIASYIGTCCASLPGGIMSANMYILLIVIQSAQ